jgi:hypothetical protein
MKKKTLEDVVVHKKNLKTMGTLEVCGILEVKKGVKLNANLLKRAHQLSLYEDAELFAPVLETVEVIYLGRNSKLHAPLITAVGHLDVTDHAILNAPALTTTTDLTLQTDADLLLPALSEANGIGISLGRGAKLHVPNLKKVANTYLTFRSKLLAPSLTKAGDISVTEASFDACQLRFVGDIRLVGAELELLKVKTADHIKLSEGSKLFAPALTKAKYAVELSDASTLKAPGLMTTGDLELSGVQISLPVLVETGKLKLDESTLTAPELTTVESVSLDPKSSLSAAKLKQV